MHYLFFFVRLSEFDNILLYERSLINVTTCQNFKDFKAIWSLKGLVKQKNFVFNSFLCKLGFFLALVGV
jgi:hypothetical protein